jgi:hypothetical protein
MFPSLSNAAVCDGGSPEVLRQKRGPSYVSNRIVKEGKLCA